MITKNQFATNILPITLKCEGGYVNDPKDAGGETYRGISKRANPDWPGWEILNSHKPLSRGDIVNSQPLMAEIISLYWEKYFCADNLHLLESPLVALQLFDFKVHGGLNVMQLQRNLNHFFATNLKEDGYLGMKTVEAMNQLPEKMVSRLVVEMRYTHINTLLNQKPEMRSFEKGWKNRLGYFRDLFMYFKPVNVA